MNIDIAPETAQLVREEIDSGRFRSLDELIKAGVEAWREKTVSRRKQVSGPNRIICRSFCCGPLLPAPISTLSGLKGFLIDTNVLSEYNRPGELNPNVKRRLETTDRGSQYVSILTLAEVRKGGKLPTNGKRRTELEQWFRQDLEAWFSGRVLPSIARLATAGPHSWQTDTELEDCYRQSTHPSRRQRLPMISPW
jgi:hypothetical protein